MTTKTTMNNKLGMERIPTHVAITMDGNGCRAVEHGKEHSFGHQIGVEAVRRIMPECVRLGAKYLALYTLSTENWSRPEDEVSALMGLVLSSLEDEIFTENNVRSRVIGDVKRLPENVRAKLQETEEHTAANSAMTMVTALNYSARWEMTHALQNIMTDVQAGRAHTDGANEELVGQRLETSFILDPDLLIRTGGELWIPNFLLQRIAYSEPHFCDTYRPDFDETDLYRVVMDYQGRQRRFEKTEYQIEDQTKVDNNPAG